MIKDKRKAVRRPMKYTAWIAQKGQPLHGCVLSDISDHGARLDIEATDSVPDEFLLFLSSRGTARRKCKVAWRTEKQIGVEFESGAAAKSPSPAKAMIAKRLAKKAEAEHTSDTEPAETA